MGVVSEEIARDELNKWLDVQDISAKQREDVKSNINIIVDAICAGKVVINTDGTLTQNLKFSIGKEAKITSLTYNNAITVGDVETKKALISKDSDQRSTLAHLAAATNQVVDVIMKMNTKDYNISAAIVIFFMV